MTYGAYLINVDIILCGDDDDERNFFFQCFQILEEWEEEENNGQLTFCVQAWRISDDSTSDL